MRDEDREGVEDDERADDEPDGREADQRQAEVADALTDGLGSLLGQLRRRDDLVARSERRLEIACDGPRRGAGIRGDVDGVEGARRREHPLRRREVERGDRHASEIGLALEAEQSHDRELLGRSLEEHADAIAHLESVCPGRAFVDEHLTFAARWPALAVVRERERACARLRPREPDRRRETVLDRVAPVTDELRVAERRPVGGRDAIDGTHPRQGRIRDASPL